jgi:hypothetical protein
MTCDLSVQEIQTHDIFSGDCKDVPRGNLARKRVRFVHRGRQSWLL